ncbi:hypothetical protein Hanom_Chr06g00551791 [Helianthus anomalus]
MLHAEKKNLWLPRDFMQHYFNSDNLFDDFVILFGENHMWNVRISRLWDINHYILYFSQVANDLCLTTGDLIFFSCLRTVFLEFYCSVLRLCSHLLQTLPYQLSKWLRMMTKVLFWIVGFTFLLLTHHQRLNT